MGLTRRGRRTWNDERSRRPYRDRKIKFPNYFVLKVKILFAYQVLVIQNRFSKLERRCISGSPKVDVGLRHQSSTFEEMPATRTARVILQSMIFFNIKISFLSMDRADVAVYFDSSLELKCRRDTSARV
jgi:hypothetical protein